MRGLSKTNTALAIASNRNPKKCVARSNSYLYLGTKNIDQGLNNSVAILSQLSVVVFYSPFI